MNGVDMCIGKKTINIKTIITERKLQEKRHRGKPQNMWDGLVKENIKTRTWEAEGKDG